MNPTAHSRAQGGSSLCQLIRRTVQLRPQSIATQFGERQRTWAELQDRITRLAGSMRELGVHDGDRVAILALNSDRYYEYYFAVAWAGAVFVPINTRLAPAEVAYWLNDSASSVLFVDETLLPSFRAAESQLESVNTRVYLGDGETPDGFLRHEDLIDHEPIPPSNRRGDDLAGIFYTGGTTGRSKGVMLSHRGLTLNPLQAQSVVQFRPSDVLLHAAPMFHIADGFLCMASATHGVKSVILPGFDPTLVLRSFQVDGITQTLLVPTMIGMVVNHPEVEKYDLSGVKRVLYGASPMPERIIVRAMEVMPTAEFVQAYGQTETSPILTILESEYHVTSGPKAGRLGSAGRALPGVEISIQDEEGNEVPRGTVGEVCARGDNIMIGYWQLPEVTEEAFRGGWLHTGDGGYMDQDGFVFIVDRVKDMIVTGGENVYSAEVENAVYQHSAVAECAVIGIPHDDWGEQVHAIVRLKPEASTTEQELIDHCRSLIAGFKCPRGVTFREDPLPLSGAGKVLKRELRKPYWQDQSRSVH